MAKERLNRALIVVYFEDGGRLQWEIKRGGPASRSRAALADELERFAKVIRPKDVTPHEAIAAERAR